MARRYGSKGTEIKKAKKKEEKKPVVKISDWNPDSPFSRPTTEAEKKAIGLIDKKQPQLSSKRKSQEGIIGTINLKPGETPPDRYKDYTPIQKAIAEEEDRIRKEKAEQEAEDAQIAEDAKWAGARRHQYKDADGNWVVEWFSMVDQPDGTQKREVLETTNLTVEEFRKLNELASQGTMHSNNPKINAILERMSATIGTADVSEGKLRAEMERQQQMLEEMGTQPRSIMGSTLREGLLNAAPNILQDALLGFAVKGPVGAGVGTATGLLRSFIGAYSANQKESVAVINSRFRETKAGLNTIPSYVNAGRMDPYLARVLYNGGMRRLREGRRQLKIKEANDWIADISDYDTPMVKFDEFLGLRGPAMEAELDAKTANPNFTMTETLDAEDMEVLNGTG
tara:strand:+ start:929 stop:2119 length:1191 start_codon:yes stop_codon:yes gene_type:complete